MIYIFIVVKVRLIITKICMYYSLYNCKIPTVLFGYMIVIGIKIFES